MKKIYFLIIAGLLPTLTFAQTTTDGLMMRKGDLCTGILYTHDQWKDYWEGTLKRDNGNIGKITTQSLVWMGNYGITDKLNVIAMVPYVMTNASKGTMHPMEGLQDLSIGVKYYLLRIKREENVLGIFGIINVSTPLSDYTPDYYPLSLGAHTTNIAYRGNVKYKHGSWFANVSAAYTWRSNTKLDRPAYDDGNTFYESDEVKMPNVFDVFVSLGYHEGPLQAQVQFTQMNTLGGGDIQRQAMPFVSNKMNLTKVGALVMYYVPMIKNLALRGSADYTVAGRNVGHSTTLLAGVLYTFQFSKSQPE